MTSSRKLEEEIARTKDPAIRKQLQELLDKRKQRRDKTIKDAKEIGASLLGEIIKETEPFLSPVAVMIPWVAVAVVLIVFFLGWVFGAW